MIKLKTDKNKLQISFKNPLNNKEVNLIRDQSEKLQVTLEKIQSKLDIYSKDNPTSPPPLIELLDNDCSIPLEKTNFEAWKENNLFSINNEHKLLVKINLPQIKHLKMSKRLIAGMPVFVRIEPDQTQVSLGEDLTTHSIFNWYISLGENESEWKLVETGIGKRMCILEDTWVNRRIKIECVPRVKNDTRDGCLFEHKTSQVIEPKIDLTNAAMTERHSQSKNVLTLKK